jgi:hypothetical protein
MLILHKDSSILLQIWSCLLGGRAQYKIKRPVSYREAGLLWNGVEARVRQKNKTKKSDWRTNRISVFKTDTSLIRNFKIDHFAISTSNILDKSLTYGREVNFYSSPNYSV